MVNGQERSTLEYNRFQRMRQRCLNPNDAAYPLYGARGIKVCSRWDVFESFIQDIGERPSPKHSLDRVDNDGHYSCGKCDECVANGWPSNCQWATPVEQANNMRPNVKVTINGRTLTLRQWAREMNVSDGTLYARHSRGLRGQDILAPVKKRKPFSRKRVHANPAG